MINHMKSVFFSVLSSLVLLINSTAKADETILGLTTGNNLIRFNSESPGTIIDTILITGVQPSEVIVGMDFRPSNRTLYAVGDTNRLYTVDLSTGVATQVGAVFGTALTGTAFGVDFNPVADRLRVVSNSNQNLRINPDDATVIVDTDLAFDAGDANNGVDPNVVAVAYTNSTAGATSTTIFGYDSLLDSLVRVGSPRATPTSPNAGLLFTIGASAIDSGENVGLDIAPTISGRAFLSLTGNDNISKLYSLDLAGGSVALIGDIGTSNNVRDISVLPGGTFDFTESNTVVGEADGSATMTVVRNGSASGAASVTVTTTDGSATAGSDYTTTTTTLTYADGERSKSFNIPITNDSSGESNETIVVTLSNPSVGTEIQGTGSVLVTISDNDQSSVAGPPVLLVASSTRLQPGEIFSGTGFRSQASCSEACTLTGTFRLADAFARSAGISDPNIGTVTATLSQAGKVDLNIVFSDAVRRAVRRRTNGNTSTFTVTATDSDNNTVTETVRIAIKR